MLKALGIEYEESSLSVQVWLGSLSSKKRKTVGLIKWLAACYIQVSTKNVTIAQKNNPQSNL